MGYCWIPNCKHKSEINKCSMFNIPRSPRKRILWKKFMRRADSSPSKNARVCSCHFADGKKTVPTLFPWNEKKRFSSKSPEKNKRIRKNKFPVVHQINFDREPPADEGMEEVENENQNLPSEVESAPNASEHDERQAEDSNEIDANEETLTEGETLKNLLQELERLQNENAQKCAENSVLQETVENLRKKIEKREEELEELKKKSSVKEVFLFSEISHKDNLVEHFTGLPNEKTFFALLKLCENFDVKYEKGWKVTKLDNGTKLFLTLLKLRRGLTNLDLGVRFKIGKDSVSNIFVSWLMLLHHVIVKTLMATIPSREKNAQSLPESFRDYPSTRIILDCTEVTSASPKLLSNQCRMYISYKHKITSKALVGCAPNGTITFVSKLYPGSTSDRNVVIDSGVLNFPVPGDTVMADKGFTISDIMPDGVTLNIPPFKDTPQFTAEQVEQTFEIARARIHIERAINRIKRYQIVNYIPQFLGKYASEVFQVCAGLTNFKTHLIKECAEDLSDEE